MRGFVLIRNHNIWKSPTGKFNKMRYKVNFHVMLWVLSSYTLNIMGNQVPNSLSHANSSIRNTNNISYNGLNTFLINESHQNTATSQQNGHLVNINEQQQHHQHKHQYNGSVDTVNTEQQFKTIANAGKFFFFYFYF